MVASVVASVSLRRTSAGARSVRTTGGRFSPKRFTKTALCFWLRGAVAQQPLASPPYRSVARQEKRLTVRSHQAFSHQPPPGPPVIERCSKRWFAAPPGTLCPP